VPFSSSCCASDVTVPSQTQVPDPCVCVVARGTEESIPSRAGIYDVHVTHTRS